MCARRQALDAVLKSVCAALLESDVNVLLVKRLRDKVKGKVLPQLEEIQAKQGQDADTMQGSKAKQIIQKVRRTGTFLLSTCLSLLKARIVAVIDVRPTPPAC